MSDLNALEQAYREAQTAFSGDRSDENRVAFKAAKLAYASARTTQREAEEADPNHSRGQSLASVSDGSVN